MKTAYYAHCIAQYNTVQEQEDVQLISDLGFKVENPNSPQHTSTSMSYYTDIVRQCDLVIFRRLPDGRISAGVWKEIQTAQQLGKPVIELPYYHNVKVLSREDTREYIYKHQK